MVTNSTKVWIFIVLTSLALLVIGYQWGERLGLLIGFILAILFNFLVFFYGENRMLVKLKARILKGQDAWGLIDTVKALSDKLDMPAPTIYITPHDSVSAFCVGHSWKNSSLCFTTGLAQKLSREEIEAVVAHQLCHIRRLDSFAFGVTSTLANSIVGTGQFIDSFLPKRMHVFKTALSPIGWLIIKSVVGQKTFFENDLMASELIQDRKRMGETLWRLEGLAETKPLDIPPCTSHLFIVNPEGFHQANLFLRSHPTIEVRLQQLLGYYPI